MITKYTPGPWKVLYSQSSHHSRAAFNPWIRILIGLDKPNGSGHEVITGRFICTITDPHTEAETATANARLIAAAPDLLEACKSLVAWNEGASSVSPVTELCQLYVVINKCKAAIKLAEEGRPE